MPKKEKALVSSKEEASSSVYARARVWSGSQVSAGGKRAHSDEDQSGEIMSRRGTFFREWFTLRFLQLFSEISVKVLIYGLLVKLWLIIHQSGC